MSDLGFIGAGNMAEAIARGVLSSGAYRPASILACDISPERRALFADELKVRAIEDAAAVASQCTTVLLCLKPQQMPVVLPQLGEVARPGTLFVSIAAGLSTRYISDTLGDAGQWRVVRAMPNTPMLVGKGMVALCAGAAARPADLATARSIFAAAAEVIEVREELMDAVTAVSGSGPAYFFFLVEQMVKAGVELGLSPEQAHRLATQTALGAAAMMTSSSDSPAELRRKVTSPNGTTHAAITSMESAGVPQQLVDAVKAAAARSKELGR
jgi:pyrroline-5-carboxylate reductase